MKTYREYLAIRKDIIPMIHLPALPGTPGHTLAPSAIIRVALDEAKLYKEIGFRTVMIENMHDVPYVKSAGPEITSLMAVIGNEIKSLDIYCGIQILAGCNMEALGAAHAAGMDFIRAEGFVFSHIGDEGMFDSCAGSLLRYRKTIGAESVMIFTDIKKKHSSHAITADVSLKATAEAAVFFRSDGIVITGSCTGEPADIQELQSIHSLSCLKIIGSGITPANLPDYFPLADVFIVGSYLKIDGRWHHPPDRDRARDMKASFERCLGGERR